MSDRNRGVLALMVLALVAGACSTSAGGPKVAEPAAATATARGPEPGPSASPVAGPSASASPSDEPSSVDEVAMPDIVRGVYTHAFSFWDDRWPHLVDLVRTTELNALVIDVKDESGTLLWDIDHPLAHAGGGGAWREHFDGLEERLQMLKDAGGWAIARIACFKDTRVADARPDLAVQNVGGGTWKARKDFSWLNPYQDEAGQWCIDVGLAALEVGFDEIQYDYIRFPNGGDGDTSVIQLPGVPAERPREEWRHSDEIVDFLARASEAIHDAGGVVSADLFGLVTYDWRWDAGGTGQVLERIAEHVDVISLMVYPSHYNPGNYGLLPHPVRYPYETVWNAMQEAQMRVQGLRATLRPWLEDFNAPWTGHSVHSPEHVRRQIQAAYDNGIEGWLLWNAGNRYSASILEPGEAVSHADPDFRPPARTANPDAAPGAPDKQWPGLPPCDPYPGRMLVGEGNLVGSRPPDRALPADDPRLCAGVADGEEATTTWQERAAAEVPEDPPADQDG
ncbi:MAG: putative glycoside hydrolase [Actinobacteria bacterium]|nr:putative glycoside hydrolase [Actinomycetota bacterium]